MSKSLKRVRAALDAAGIETQIAEMPDSTRTAAEAAQAVDCDIDQIAKSVIFRGTETDRVYLFVTAGGNRVDLEKAARVTGEALGPADAAFIRERTGFAIGGVAPLGHLEPPTAFFDPRLSEFSKIWAAAGTPRHMFPVDSALLARKIDAQVSAFTA